MEINERNIKLWSSIGPRATLGLAVNELAKVHDDLVVLTCDVSTSAGLDRFKKTHPEKYFDVGIAEQNLIGIAAGFASENFNVLTTTFVFGGNFISLLINFCEKSLNNLRELSLESKLSTKSSHFKDIEAGYGLFADIEVSKPSPLRIELI